MAAVAAGAIMCGSSSSSSSSKSCCSLLGWGWGWGWGVGSHYRYKQQQQQQLWLISKVIPRHGALNLQAKARTRREDRTARHVRIRKKVDGVPERPRLSVFRSNKHLYVQVIDDSKMHTLASASTMQKPISEEFNYSSGPTMEVARKIGEAIAKSCLEKGITKVAFDRGGYPYHGCVKALADAARENGLAF